jgi:hypothetical protein
MTNLAYNLTESAESGQLIVKCPNHQNKKGPDGPWMKIEHSELITQVTQG